jgi:hypothetical protein
MYYIKLFTLKVEHFNFKRGQLRLLVLGVFMMWATALHAQRVTVPQVNQNVEEAVDDEFEYTNEWNYGVNFNTSAGLIGGGMVKYVWKTADKKWYEGFMVSIAHIKNPKEERVTNQVTSSSFILYKQNYLFPLRFSYVRELILFRKAPEEGIHVNAMFAAGPSIGLLKPYYILYSADNNLNNSQSVPYDPRIHRNNQDKIYGVGSAFDGFDKLKAVMGFHAQLGLNFEFGFVKSNVVGVQTGFLMEKYTQTMPIMDVAPNNSFFTSAFVTFYYGRKK